MRIILTNSGIFDAIFMKKGQCECWNHVSIETFVSMTLRQTAFNGTEADKQNSETQQNNRERKLICTDEIKSPKPSKHLTL